MGVTTSNDDNDDFTIVYKGKIVPACSNTEETKVETKVNINEENNDTDVNFK